MRLHLVDHGERLVKAWNAAFRHFPEVTIQQADMLEVAEHCVVSPANSYGFMDGGIDTAYREFFGAQIERKVQDAIARRPDGLLPVGASLVVHTGHPRVRYLIVAPTMTVPEVVESQNCYRALRAVLRIAGSDSEIGRDVYCPGLATGVGRVPAEEAANMMARAYADWKRKNEPSAPPNAGSADASPAPVI